VSDSLFKRGCVFGFWRRAQMRFVMGRVLLVLGLGIMYKICLTFISGDM